MKREPMLILVDDQDREYGKIEKQLAHQLGLLHRAFSVFIFNSKGELLLQQRADAKYHSGGLWTNTCCSHPEYGENINYAAGTRLRHEMGLDAECEPAFSFIYKAQLDKGLTEHEYDHVFIGISDDIPEPNSDEVKNWKYESVVRIKDDLKSKPEQFTAWFRICFEEVIKCDKFVLMFPELKVAA